MKIYKGFRVILVLCLMVSFSYAQGDRPRIKNSERNAERELMKQRVDDLNRREDALHALDLQRDLDESKEDADRIRREEIARNLRQLKENNEKLFSLTRVLDERGLKDTANLANKLAKVSKDLRRSLELKGKKDTNNFLEIPLSSDEKIEQLRQLASKLNDLVSQVSKAQTIGSVDASQIDETEQNLQEIESSANKMKLLAGKK